MSLSPQPRTSSNMAPVVAEATGAAVMALLLSVSPTVVMGGGRNGNCNGASQPQRGRRRPVVKVLAWGHGGGLGHSSNQVEMDPNRPSLSRGGGAVEGTDYSNDRMVDDSWTHAAFKAFHEMRAGRPLSTLVLDEEEEDEEQNEQGPLVAVRRLASRLTRCETYQGSFCASGSTRYGLTRKVESWLTIMS